MFYIVDDSNALRERLVEILSDVDGANVIGQAANASEAILGIRNLKPRVVILDIQMPGASGIEVLKEIKHDGDPPIVIMLTNHAYAEYKQKCSELGAEYFLDKTKGFHNLPRICKQLIKRLKPQV